MSQEAEGNTSSAEQPSAVTGPLASALDASREVLGELLAQMGVNVKLDAHEDDESVTLDVTGADAGLLVGKKGKTLDALQYLVNRMVRRRVGPHKLIVIDSDGYRERRDEALIELASRLSEKARGERKIVALNPMSPRDRRIIHVALRDEPGVFTRSEGEGDDRHLVIVPEG